MLTIATAYAIIGLLLIGLSIPLIRGKVRPNHWYGFRVRLTVDDPDIWYPVNAWAGRWMCNTGAAVVIAALGALWVPEALFAWYSLALAILLVLSVVLILLFGLRYARRLNRSQQ